MEKYLIILVIAFIAYYSYKCFTDNKVEGFADAQTVDGIDESNSINTLAKIAKDIMDGGGLKIAGDATVAKALHVTGAKNTPAGSGDMLTHFNHPDGNNYIRGNTFLNGILTIGQMSSGEVNINSQISKIGPEKNKFTLHTPDDNRKALYIAPSKDDAVSDWEWGSALNLNRGGNHNLGGNLNLTGNLVVGGTVTEKVNVIYPINWDMSKWSEKAVTFFKKDEADGTKREFLYIHPGNMDPNYPNRWIARMTGIKVGRQVYFFETGPRHENVPNPANNDANDPNWRRNIP